MLIWASFSDQWQINHKVTFDGANKLIYVATDVNNIDVKVDIYSSWKEWSRLYDNAKFLPAIRTIGGDPVGGGQYAGDIYFLQNGWRVVVNHPVTLSGTLYTEEGESPYIIEAGGGVTATVSSLVQSIGFQGTINNIVEPNILPQDIWDYLLENANTPGSVGERFSKLLTVAKFLGLK